MMMNVKTLSLSDWLPYRRFTYPSMAGQVQKWLAQPNGRLALFGADYAGAPAGLAVLEWDGDQRRAHMHSLYIDPVYRRKGLATFLMERVREYCLERQIRSLRFVYVAGKAGTAAIESWLAYLGCTAPRTETLVFHVDHRIASAPWLKERRLPQGLELKNWADIRPDLLDALRNRQGDAYPAYLSPFKTFAPKEPSCCFAVVSKAAVEGWSVAYRLKEDTLLYDAIYVSSAYRQSGLAFVMLACSIRAHLRQAQTIPWGLFAVNVSNANMARLANKWIAPYAAKTVEKKSCELEMTRRGGDRDVPFSNP